MSKLLLNFSNKIITLGVLLLLSLTAFSQRTTLHLIHLADAEASTPAVNTAPNFAALVDAFIEEGEQINAVNLVLSSGDNYLPGPFFSAAGDRSMKDIFRQATGNPTAREGSGHADIAIHNLLGVRASAIGNHEFDLGTDKFGDLMAGDVRSENEVRSQGADFPYLSANLDFSNDGSLADLFTKELLNSNDYALVFDEDITPVEKKISPWTIVTQNGVDFGIIGATTPIVESISSTNGVVAKQPGGGTNNMQDLATILQGYVDQLTQQGIDKIIILAHMQQLQLERELIGNLSDVDIIIAGGSNSILAEEDERLFEGDSKVDDYPIITETADGDPALIVNTDGGYKYVGRLLVDFDESGLIDIESLNREISGAYIADDQMVENYYESVEEAFSSTLTNRGRVKLITDGIESVIASKDGNTFGWTDVFLEGRRAKIRTGETNYGNLTADANLWYAKSVDPSVRVSLKNGGGIRAEIGSIKTTGINDFELAPPSANDLAGKMEGQISQLDIENSLRFNNNLSLLTLTASQLVEVLEHGVAATGEGSTPGQFAHLGGVRIEFDASLEAGSRIINAYFIDEDGQDVESLVIDGNLQGDASRPVRIVTLGFLAGGGDSYPYDGYAEADAEFFNRVDLDDSEQTNGNATFAFDGTEQDALAEYLSENYGSKSRAFKKGKEGRIIQTDKNFTLHLIHLADAEASIGALETAPNFAALVDAFLEQGNDLGVNNVILSAGDNYLPGPFMSGAGDRSMRDVFRAATGNVHMREGNGRADIEIHNILGVEASAIGNHEFDFGPNFFGDVIVSDIRDGGESRYLGTQFPYLSANLDFSNDGDLGELYTDEILPNSYFRTNLTDLEAPEFRISAATIIEKDGERIGVVGATTPIVANISSLGDVKAKQPGGLTNDMEALASILQKYIDQLTELGINKIILVTHMQQLALERELIGYLEDVDIIIGGGSNSILADNNDRLMSDDEATDTYPIITVDANDNPALIVNTDGGFKYVGRLLVDFDAFGNIITESINEDVSGAWAADEQNVTTIHGNIAEAFSDPNSRAAKVNAIVEGVEAVIVAKDGNTFGWTDVFIEGRRAAVRTQETNFGNLSADANLWYAQQYDPSVQVSLKNGGGIRAEIGAVVASGVDNFELVPPLENALSGKQDGEISQLDIENSLRFNNGLTLFTLTAEQLLEVMEHAVSASGDGATPGQFAQVGGLRFSFDVNKEPGSRVGFIQIIEGDETVVDVIAEEGQIIGDPNRLIRCVSLNFLVNNGGDSYPYPEYKAANESQFNEVNLVDEDPAFNGVANFTGEGSEQDAIAEYLSEFHGTPETAFNGQIEGRIVQGANNVTDGSVNLNDIYAFPNPTTGETNLRVDLINAGELRLEISNSLGQIVAIKELGYFGKGKVDINYDLSKFISGRYYLNIKGNKFNATAVVNLNK